MKISVVIPVYNESGNINPLYNRLKKAITKISKSYEIIFIDDGSHDNTKQKILTIRQKDKKVKLVSFSRNFGHMSAVNAGLAHSKGNHVIVMDADLQDPPEIIEKMYKKALQGHEVVYGIKVDRKEGAIRKFFFKSFYKTLNSISFYKMPLDSGTFSVLDKKVVNILNNLPEKNKYFSGLRSWTGFKQAGVTYERRARLKGKAMPLRKLFRLALDGLLSFSYVPLRIASFFGFLFALFAFVFIILVLVARFIFGWGITGWASTMSAILLIGGVQLITLGIIGEYLARIYDEVKNRPEYIIQNKVGL